MQKTCPRVSVITPVFRGEATLQRSLDSLMSQSERSWEAIVVDDGSPDDGWKIAAAYAYFDDRFTLIRRPNQGAGAARNAALARATGEFVLFLDADDWLEPDALRLLTNACQWNFDAVHGAFRYYTHDGQPTDWVGAYAGAQSIFDALCGSNVLSMPAAVLVRRTVLSSIGGFDESLHTCGDWDLWGRVARRRGRGFGRIDACVAGYRMRAASLSHNATALQHDAFAVLRRLHSPDSRVTDPHPSLVNGARGDQLQMRCANFALYAAGLALANGQLDVAISILGAVDSWESLSMIEAAGYLLSAICFARCRGPESIADFWPEVHDDVTGALAWLEQRSRIAHLATRMLAAMDRQSGGQTPSRLPHRPHTAEPLVAGAANFSPAPIARSA